MLAQIPAIATQTAKEVVPKVVDVIVLNPIVVKNGLRKSTVLLLVGLSFAAGFLAKGFDQFRRMNNLD